VIAAVADPLFPPKHDTLVLDVIDAVPPDAFEMVAVAVVLHPLASVTVTV